MGEKGRRWRRLFVAAAVAAIAAAWVGAAIAWFPRVGGWHAQDLSLYRSAAQHVLNGQVPYRDFGLEYPPGVLLPLTLPGLVVGRGASLPRFALALLISNALWAVALGWCIWRAALRWFAAERALAAVGMYVLLAFVGAPLFPWRFDLFPALLSALALVLTMEGLPATAGACLAAGIATKLYPIVFAPIILARHLARGERGNAFRFAGFTCAATLLIFAPFLLAAPADFLSFLRYHQLRGLQIESVPAGLLMLGHAFGFGEVGIVENFGALHLVSPASAAVMRLLFPAFLVGLASVAVLAFARFRYERIAMAQPRDQTLIGYALVSLLVFMLTNKVLSPQFVIWLLPFVALLPVPQYTLALAATALTIVIFPFNYDGLVRLETPIVLLLNLRNLLLAGLTASVLWRLRPLAAEKRVMPGIAKVGSANHLDSPTP
jgi:uncharacterized membrane protein